MTLASAMHPSLAQCVFRLSFIDPNSGRCADCGRYAKEHTMTLDLDELEENAKAAAEWVNDQHAWNNGRLAPDVVLALIERVRDAEAEKAADAERAEYWRVEANRVHAEELAKANERIRFLEGAIRAARSTLDVPGANDA